MAAHLIEIKHLVKHFGPIEAVRDISFTVGRGEVLGFLGPNGAGKSTTMKMIAGFLTPTAGTAVICGHDVIEQPIAAKRCLGYLPEGAPAYPDMTCIAFLDFVAQIRGFHGEEKRRRILNAVDRVELGGVLHQPIDTLSKVSSAASAWPRRCCMTGSADPGRADRRPGPEPEVSGAHADPGHGQGQGDHHLDPYSGRGRRRLHPRHGDRQRPCAG
ncbi:MAG: ABC transporter ATP-binding protein [Aliidongia sp.]